MGRSIFAVAAVFAVLFIFNVSSDESACKSMKGVCQDISDDTLKCDGEYKLELCSSSKQCCKPAESASCDTTIFVSRAGWGARQPRSQTDMPKTSVPVGDVFIHHTATSSCTTTTNCKALVGKIQDYHMDTKDPKWDDIGYSFLVGNDGKVYEGRGWTRVGAHTYGYNYKSLGFSMIGGFSNVLPNQAAWNALKIALQCGIDGGHISRNYRLRGHRDADGASTACPGNQLYALIKKMPRWIGKS